MAGPFSARRAGVASLAAAALILVSQLSQLIIPMVLTESFWIATQSLRMGLALVAMFALLVAVAALYSSQIVGVGRLGLVAYLMASLGTVLIAGNWWYEAVIGPVLRVEAPELLATAPSGSILVVAAITSVTFAIGWAVFGIASLRAGVLPRPRSIFLIAAGLAGFLALISPFQIPLALAVGWAGAWLVRLESRTAAEPVAVPAAA
jgi:hypothetical protein